MFAITLDYYRASLGPRMLSPFQTQRICGR